MLADEGKLIEEIASKRILKIRQTTSEAILNFDDEDYVNSTGWESMNEHSLTKRVNTSFTRLEATSDIEI